MGKKALNKRLRKEASGLGVIMKQAHENHIRKGSELIVNGQIEIDGKAVDPNKTYLDPLPVSVAINHHRRLKKLVNKYGLAAVEIYKTAVNDYQAKGNN